MAARNRPRGGVVKEDLADEFNLWNSIVEKIKKSSAVNKKYLEIAENILLAEEKLVEEESSDSIAKLDELEKSHREGLKAAEEELKILNEEPDEVIKNLETLISVRAAFETEPPRAANPSKPRNLKRRLDSDAGDSPAPVLDPQGASTRVQSKVGARSSSIAAAATRAEGAIDSTEGIKGVASDKQGKLVVGAEVFYKNKQKGAEGEGILCHITNVIGDGKQRRYEIQDSDPEPGAAAPPYRASVTSLVAIPSPSTPLPELPKGKQVLALYPNTTTFYKAEIVSTRKDQCRLRFEGEEEKDKEILQDVDRRYVLDVK